MLKVGALGPSDRGGADIPEETGKTRVRPFIVKKKQHILKAAFTAKAAGRRPSIQSQRIDAFQALAAAPPLSV